MSKEQKLKDIFFSPLYGMSGLNQFIINVNKLHPYEYTRDELKEFYKN